MSVLRLTAPSQAAAKILAIFLVFFVGIIFILSLYGNTSTLNAKTSTEYSDQALLAVSSDGNKAEGYKATILDYDYGDAPDPTYPTQTESLLWAKDASGADSDYGRGVAVDSSGNSYVTGSYNTSAVFGEGEINETTLSGGFSETFVARYNSDGSLVWATDAGGGNNAGHAIAVDSSGNIYVTGSYYQSAVFGAGESNETTLSGIDSELFVAKYNSNGTLAWATDAGATGFDYGYGIAVDGSGNSYVTGTYEISAVFGEGEVNETTLSGFWAELFVAKYNSSGNLVWAIDAGGYDDDIGKGIAVDNNGNSYVVGFYYVSTVFGEGEINQTTLSGASAEMFLAKYNSDGTLAWAKDAGGPSADYGHGISLDSSGNIYVTGEYSVNYSSSAVFGEGETNETMLSGTWSEIFVAKYNGDGTLAWATDAGGATWDYVKGIAVDNNGNSYITGQFYPPAVFGEGEINETMLSGSYGEIFVAKYNSDGTLAWATDVGGEHVSRGNGIAVDSSGNCYVTGYYNSSVVFGAGEVNETTLSGAYDEIFVAKYNDMPKSTKHSMDGSIYLGACVDSELVGQPSAGSLGDDNNIGTNTFGTCDIAGDDEDGVTFDPILPIGLTSSIDVEASTAGNLNTWVDFNADGDWNDTGEQVFADEFLASGTNSLSLFVPPAAHEGETYARFRFSTDTGLNYDGIASNGEVEDYKMKFIHPYDYGDAPDPTYPTQTSPLLWAKGAGGAGRDEGMGIAVDSSGNSYVTGYYETTVVLGPGEVNETTLSGTSTEIFVAKYHSNGTLAWATDVEGSSGDIGIGIAVDSGGNSYVTGYYNGTAIFGSGEVNETSLSGTGNEIFVAKYNNNGTLAWAKNAGGAGPDAGTGIAVDSSGNSYVTGYYDGTAIFGQGELNQTTLSGISDEIFVAKYNANGTLAWATDAGSSSYDAGNGIAVDSSGNIYVAGYYFTTAVFGAGELNETTLSGIVSEIFVAKYNNDGTLTWAIDAGGLNNDRGTEIAVDSNGNSYVCGIYNTTTVFGEGEINEVTLSGTTNEIFVAKYNNDGTLAWAKDAGGSNNDGGTGIAVDSRGSSYVTGYYDTSVVFGEGEINEITFSGTTKEIFVAKYNNDGTLAWATDAGGPDPDIGRGVAVDSNGKIYVTGYYNASAVFGEGEVNESTLAGSGMEIFVAKYTDEPAKHLMDGVTYLGDCVDSETDGQQETSSLGDNNNAGAITFGTCDIAGDDEDGVTFDPVMPIGLTSSIDVEASTTGKLNAWIDFNADGDWNDTGEQIFTDELLIAGTNSISFFVPPDTLESETYARFRFSIGTGLTYYGHASDGEVEDYKMNFTQPYDYGDAPDPAYPTQINSLLWAKDAGGTSGDIGNGIAVDSNGNSYVAGKYDTSTVFGIGEVNETTLSGISEEIFVAKYNSDGTLAWATDAGGSGSDSGIGIAIDRNGSIYVTGKYSTSAVFGAGEVNETTLSGIGDEIFVAKYNNDGTLAWAKNAGGSGIDWGFGIAADSSGNIYVTGKYSTSAVFGEGEVNETTLSGINEEIFIAKYNSDGILVWALDAGGSYEDVGRGIAVDSSGNSYVTGYYVQSAVFGEGEVNETTLLGSAPEIFIAKYDGNGTLAWAVDAGSSSNDWAYAIAVDGSGNSYITGHYRSSAVFGEGEVNETTLSGFFREFFVAKYNNDGTLAWAKGAVGSGESNSDIGNGIAVDNSGNSYVIGFFEISAVFGQGEVNETTLSGSSREIFVAKYNSDGTLAWATSSGGPYFDYGNAIAIDSSGNSYVAGQYHTSAVFGSGEVNESTLSGTDYEIFVAKYTDEPAKHLMDGVTYLGGCVDSEADGQQDAGSLGDDNNGGAVTFGTCIISGDDEDGVNFDPIMSIGLTSNIDVAASTTGKLNAWIDFNADGDWNDTREQIFTDELLIAGTNSLSFFVPPDTLESETYARFRFSTDTGLFYYGQANDGEVEDYKMNFMHPPYDYGDAPGTMYQTQTSSLHWVKGAGGAFSDWGAGIAVDDSDNSYVTGGYVSSVVFGEGEVNETTLSGTGISEEIFVVKYNSNGTLAWAKDVKGASMDRGNAIVVDSSGNSYVTGHYTNSAVFGEGEVNETTLSGASTEIFLAKYSSDGMLSWATDAGGSNNDEGNETAVDGSGNSYVTGYYDTLAVFGEGEINEVILSGSNSEIFIAKYNSDGTLAWAKDAGGANTDIGAGIAVDGSGNIYVTGYYDTSAVFGEGEVNETILFGTISEIFIAKYNSDGTLAWATDAGGANTDAGAGIAVDSSGNSYVTGFYDISAVFGSGEVNETALSGPNYEIFVAKYNTNGTLAWAKGAGGPNYDGGNGIAVDGSGNSYVTGYYETSAVYGTGESSETTLSGSSREIFVAKYNTNGMFAWATDAGGSNYDGGNGIAVDGSGSIYVTGHYDTSAVFGEGEANETALSGAYWEIFVAKYTVMPSFHLLDGATYLGACVDSETDGQPQPEADGDDNNTGTITIGTCGVAGDDEDGVTFTSPVVTGLISYIDVEASTVGNLNAWIDYNADGDWSDANEQIFTDQALLTGTNNLSVTIPQTAALGDTYTRFRFSTETGLFYYGQAHNGEVEDYLVTITRNDSPTITLLEPDGVNDTVDTSYTIVWTDSDTEDNAAITLFYDTDNSGQNGTQITDCDPITEDDPADSCTWDTSFVASGNYYVYAIIDDGVNTPVVDYSDGPVTINLPPTIQIIEPDGSRDLAEDNFTITWVDGDVDNNATITLFYDTDNSGTDGAQITDCDPILEDDIADSCIWDTSEVPEGPYYIYAIIDDGINVHVADYSYYPVLVNRQGICPTSLCNGDFESPSELEYWIPGNGTNQTVTDVVQDGVKAYYSEHVYNSGQNPRWSGVWQNIMVESAQTYGLTGFYQSANAAQGHIKISWKDTSGGLLQVDYPVINMNGTNTNWIEFSKLVIAPAGAFTAEIKIWHGVNTSSQNVLGSKLWIDSLLFEVATTACGTLCNESFEHGILYWIQSGAVGSHTIEQTGAHEGLKTLKSEQLYLSGDPTKWAGVTQYAQVKEGTTYRLRLWLKTVNAANGHVRIRWRDDSGGLINTQYPIGGINGTNSTWFKSEANVTAPVYATRAEIAIWHGVTSVNVTGSTMWVDDITMICLSLCNGGFEDGNVHWETNGINEGEIVLTDVWEGSQSLKIVQNLDSSVNTQWAGVSQRTLVTGENGYNLSFWIKKENTVQGHVKVKWRDINDQLITQQFPIGGINGTDLTWTQVSTTLTAPPNAGTVEVFIWHGVNGSNNNAIGSTLYIDDVKFTANIRPVIQIVEPDGINDLSDTNYLITWTDYDPEEDASISLYYDSNNTGEDGTLIVSGISENDPSNFFSWNTMAIASGDYYIYGVIDDGVNSQVADYSYGPVTINHAPAIEIIEPNGVDDLADTIYTITWTDEDYEDDAAITLFYDTDNTGQDGIQITDCDPISEDDPSDSCLWDTTAMPVGDYYIYGLIDDGVNLQVVDYSSGAVTVSHAISGDDNYEENDARSIAYPFSELIWLSTHNGYGLQYDADWYTIYVTPDFQRVIVDCQFIHSNGNIDVALYDASGTLIGLSTTSTDNEFIEYLVPEGGVNYYIKVYGQNTGNTYDLWWDDLQFMDDLYEENDTLATAYLYHYEQRWLSSPSSKGLGIQADEDWYKIFVTTGYERVLIDCRFTHNQGNIGVALYDHSFSLITFEDTSTDNEYVDYMVPLGGEDYYIKVYGDNARNNYDLWWDDILSVSPTININQPIR